MSKKERKLRVVLKLKSLLNSKRDLTTLQVLFHINLSEIVESLLKVQFANSKIFLQILKTKKSDSLYLQRKTISHPILLNLLSHMQGKV